MVKFVARGTAMVVFAVALTSCSSNANNGRLSSGKASSSEVAARKSDPAKQQSADTTSITARTPTPHPSNFLPCSGVSSAAEAKELVVNGSGVALILAVVTEQSPAFANHTQTVKLATATLLTGSLPAGPVNQLDVAAADEKQPVLPPGKYVLVVGHSDGTPSYFLADGPRGSFDVGTDDVVAQRCPTANGSITNVRRSAVTVPMLQAIFSDALN